MRTCSPIFAPFARFVGVAWMLGGIAIMVIGTPLALSRLSSRHWPHVQGHVTQSGFSPVKNSRGGVAYYKVSIIYTYSTPSKDTFPSCFQNEPDSADNLSNPGGNGGYGLAKSQRLVGQYPPGKQVIVYYNPNSPQKATLNPGVNWIVFFPVAGLLLVPLGILLFLFAHVPEDQLAEKISRASY